MIKLLTKLPNDICVAFSGGVDSVAVFDFLNQKHNVSIAFFHHNTENSNRSFDFVNEFSFKRKIPLFLGFLNTEKNSKLSEEEHWRNERYKFLESLNIPVITAHNLNDCVETYLYSSLHGRPKVIPMSRNNIIRPFLTTPKQEFVSWCERKNLSWYEDTSNKDTKYMRNYIRHELMPHALHVNPGLVKVVKKIVEKKIIQNT